MASPKRLSESDISNLIAVHEILHASKNHGLSYFVGGLFLFFTNKTVFFFPEDLPAMDQGLSLEVFGLEVQ